MTLEEKIKHSSQDFIRIENELSKLGASFNIIGLVKLADTLLHFSRIIRTNRLQIEEIAGVTREKE